MNWALVILAKMNPLEGVYIHFCPHSFSTQQNFYSAEYQLCEEEYHREWRLGHFAKQNVKEN